MTNPTPTINQQDIDISLAQLKELRKQITLRRAEIAPLETQLKQSHDEFQAVVGATRRQSMRLQAEISNLRAQISSLQSDGDDSGDLSPPVEGILPTKDFFVHPGKDSEDIEKDKFYQHLMGGILDPIDDEDLFADLQNLCQDPTVSLAEILERSPWGIIWQARTAKETMTDQHDRLQQWEKALKQQLKELNRSEERLRADSRYGLWQQQQKGIEVWQQFLQQAMEQQEDQNHELQNDLEALRQELEQVRGDLT
jgi:chromosome segregation ATPase